MYGNSDEEKDNGPPSLDKTSSTEIDFENNSSEDGVAEPASAEPSSTNLPSAESSSTEANDGDDDEFPKVRRKIRPRRLMSSSSSESSSDEPPFAVADYRDASRTMRSVCVSVQRC
ncbi:hypothetical protein DAPPUDRAFT_115537 [Daphnia pulex]|uniref:Uncharacterized protein n=1 Tax=Daphnia pulex TaxID=6669 RepID=E9HLQ4_DAPPU|nr:hypothetical protein DAPPUDRAFT_337159 [Daphnia pulex]EFX67328.1 hypothetical protein DAPPUDRAFT_115537 [Daphnia pulex]|eukprot:EFX62288.1 hypothetical protein DAPPUDRAFT_337159 [Daphnia pulex]